MWWRRLRYVLLLVALCAIATCPTAKRSCTAKTRTAEADTLLGYLADRVAAHVAAEGRVPPTAAGPTPQPGCCEQGGTCGPDATVWAQPGWLNASLADSFLTLCKEPKEGWITLMVEQPASA